MNEITLRCEIEQLTKIEAEIDRLQRRKEAIRNNLRIAVLTMATPTPETTPTTPTTPTTQTPQTSTQTLELVVPSAGVTLRLTSSTVKRIDTTRLKAERPDIAALYTKLVLREQLTVKTGLPTPAIPQPSALVKEQKVR